MTIREHRACRRHSEGCSSAPDHPDTLEQPGNLANAYHDSRPDGRGHRAVRGRRSGSADGRARPRPPRHAQQPQQPRLRLPTPGGRPRPSRCSRRRSSCREAKLGPDHPTRSPPATTSPMPRGRGPDGQGDRDRLKRCSGRGSKLGPDHLDTLAERNNLALAYHDAGRTAEAIPIHEETLKLRREARPRPPRHAHQPQQPRPGLPARRPHGRGDRDP